MMNLKDNQKEAIDKFKELKVGALFMEAGCGKTRTMLEIIKTINDYKNILWITPFSTKENLKKEILKWAQAESNIKIVGIETIQSSNRTYLELYEWVKSDKAIIIVDESFKIKNNNAIRTKRINELGKLSEYRFILNGTPIAKNYLDLHSQINFLSPKILNMGFIEFKKTFCEYVEIEVKKNRKTLRKYEIIKDYHNLDYLYKCLEPYIYNSSLDLNKNKKYIDVPFFYCEESIQEYHEIINCWEKKALYYDKYIEMIQKIQHCISIQENKDIIIEKLIDNNSIIFCKFIDTKKHLENKFNCKVLTYSSGAIGLNLQDYNKIFFYDKTFDYLQREQSEHRIYRTGQENDCIFYDLTGNVPIDKIINENIENKVILLDYIKKLISEGGVFKCLKKN